LEALTSSPDAFALVTGLKVADAFCPFEGALANSLKSMRRASNRDRPWWTPRLIVLNAASEVIGLVGFKGPPREGAVEIGYSVSPGRQGCGFATEAIASFAGHAVQFSQVEVVVAYTLPAPSASTRVLEKCGFQKVSEIIDPVEGPVWRWERMAKTA